MENDLINVDIYTSLKLREKRRSIFDPNIPPPTPAQNTDVNYKTKLETEIKEWTVTLQKKYLRTKKPPPHLKAYNVDEPNLKLTDVQEIYLSQQPDFHKMISDRKELVKTIEYYLSLRSHVVEDIEYRHKLMSSVANKMIRDIIAKAIYE